MRSKVKLRDKVCEGERFEFDVVMVSRETGAEIDRPLAGNIVRDLDITDLTTF